MRGVYIFCKLFLYTILYNSMPEVAEPIVIDFDQTNPGLITFGTILNGEVEFMIHEYSPTDINVEFTKEHADHENIDDDDPSELLLQIENAYRAARGYELIEV